MQLCLSLKKRRQERFPGSKTVFHFRLFHSVPGESPLPSAGAPGARQPALPAPRSPRPPLWPRPAPPSPMPIGLPSRRRVQSQRLAPNSNRCFHLNREGAAAALRAEQLTPGTSRAQRGWATWSPARATAGGSEGCGGAGRGQSPSLEQGAGGGRKWASLWLFQVRTWVASGRAVDPLVAVRATGPG